MAELPRGRSYGQKKKPVANGRVPHVSVGMPVFNGERYIEQAIESIVSQTFADFELIISDNASTDDTEQICKRYSAGDPRIRYYRNDCNRGAAWNHNRVVELANGEYFKWQCHDDYCDRTLLEKCLAILHHDPAVVLCYPQFVRVDAQGKVLGVKGSRVLGDAEPRARFRSIIYRRDSCEEIYGVTRTAVIRMTALIGPYSNSDDTFLAELILHGRFREVPEALFFYRIHSGQSTNAYPTRSVRMAWFRPEAQSAFSLPFLRLLLGYMSLLWRSPLRWRDRASCYSYLVGWCWHFKGWLKEDLRGVVASGVGARLGPSGKKYARRARDLWHRMRGVEKRLSNPQLAARRAKRLQRERMERWDLGSED
jgi:glycosyltransferase involved in cell wall biosynthesis